MYHPRSKSVLLRKRSQMTLHLFGKGQTGTQKFGQRQHSTFPLVLITLTSVLYFHLVGGLFKKVSSCICGRFLRIKYEADCRGWWPKNYMNLRKPNLGISGGAGFKIGRSLLNPKAEKSTGIWLIRHSLVWWRQQPCRRIFLNALYLTMLQSNHSFHLCYGDGVVFLPFSIFPLWVEVKGKCSRSIIMILSPSWQATSTPLCQTLTTRFNLNFWEGINK